MQEKREKRDFFQKGKKIVSQKTGNDFWEDKWRSLSKHRLLVQPRIFF